MEVKKIKKILVSILLLILTVFSFSDDKGVEDKLKKYDQYKKLVSENREKQLKKDLPSPEEMEIYYIQEKLKLEEEKLEYEKKLAYERAEAERRRDNLINSVIIGGIGYGGYRLGRHHHWW